MAAIIPLKLTLSLSLSLSLSVSLSRWYHTVYRIISQYLQQAVGIMFSVVMHAVNSLLLALKLLQMQIYERD